MKLFQHWAKTTQQSWAISGSGEKHTFYLFIVCREGTSVNISANVTIDMSMSIQSLQDDQSVPQPQNEEYDFDKESENDITSAAFFVKDIFLYLKSREVTFCNFELKYILHLYRIVFHFQIIYQATRKLPSSCVRNLLIG